MLISSIILKPRDGQSEDVVVSPEDTPATEAKLRKSTKLTTSNKSK
jgi:hypothetical protein